MPIFRCPGRSVPRIAWEICRDYVLLDAGIMPAPGGLLDQAAGWIQAVGFIGRERAKYLKKSDD
ncbi:MAG: hypothetical protein M0R66_04355 [Candidatus Omnitrophica bacterium]|nr:hypothetical protein [Candidatus Omnitrophota bacterium]